MFLEYYKLREQPFGVTSDPRFLYLSATHREALASLLYGVKAGCGFVALIAKPGMGKTTLILRVLDQLRDSARIVFLFQAIYTPMDFLYAVLVDLGVHATQANLVELHSKLNEVFAEQSRSAKPLIIVVDEAQNLSDSVLELVRMLSNFETSNKKLIQIILSGQLRLAEKLASPELAQLRQRISIFAPLKPLSPEETRFYVEHRMRLAGCPTEEAVFSHDALALIARWSEGIPRNINNLCFNALSLGCALKRQTIDCDIIREAIVDRDLKLLRDKPSTLRIDEENTREVLRYIPSTGARSGLAKWLLQLAINCTILLALGGGLLYSHEWVAPRPTLQEKRAHLPSAPTDSSSFEVRGAPHTAPTIDLLVKPGQTLSKICIENFGHCNPERMQEIRRLNPWLRNLDHIESGQKIRVAAVQELVKTKQGSLAQSHNNVERSTP